MKQFLMFALGLAFTTSVFSQQLQENQVPALTLNKFKTTYGSTAINAVWEKVSQLYIVAYEQNGRKKVAMYDGNGYIKQLSTELSKKDLPKDVVQLVKATYGKGYQITSVKEVEHFTRKASYELILTNKEDKTLKVSVDNGRVATL